MYDVPPAFEHLVAAVEGMLGGLTHLQQTVPQMYGMGPVLTAARARMQEMRNLMRPPEPPVVQAEDPPKIEDIHGELPNAVPTPDDTEPPKPEAPAEKPDDAPEVPVPVEPAPPVPDTPPDVAPPVEPQPDHS